MSKQYNSFIKKQKLNQIILVHGRQANGEKFYAYLNLNKKIISLNARILDGKSLNDIRKLGTIVYYGTGEGPTDEIRKLVENT